MSPAPPRRPPRTHPRPPATGPSVERFAIAIVLIVLGTVALAAELLGQLTEPDSDATVVVALLLALLPVIGLVILVVDIRAGQAVEPVRRRRPRSARTGARRRATSLSESGSADAEVVNSPE